MATRHVYPIGLTMVLAFVQSCPAMAQIGPSDKLQLSAPFATPSVRNGSKVVGWPQGRMPTAAPEFEVSLFAENLDSPRSTYILPNGDVLVVEATREFPGRPDKSANRITLLRDTNQDGKPELREVFLSGLSMPHGMLLVGNWFYVGNTDGVVRYPYRSGQTRIDAKGEKILDLPAGGHYTRNLIADGAGRKIYVAIGSASNIDEENAWEKDPRRAPARRPRG